MQGPLSDSDCTALRDKACALLLDSGERQAALLLRESRLWIEPCSQVWSISGRSVCAHRAFIFVPQEAMLALRQRPELHDQMRSAIAAIFDAPSRVLRELSIVLEEQPLASGDAEAGSEGHPYRGGHQLREPPQPGQLRIAARQYALLLGDESCAGLLARCQVYCQSVPSQAPEQHPCYRLTVLLSLEDLAKVQRDPSLRSRLTDVLRTVGQTPYRSMGEVMIGPKLVGQKSASLEQPSVQQAVSVLQDLLAAEGITSVVIGAVQDGLRLVVADAGLVAVVDVIPGEHSQTMTDVLHVKLDADGADWAQSARRVQQLLRRHKPNKR